MESEEMENMQQINYVKLALPSNSIYKRYLIYFNGNKYLKLQT